MQAESFDPTRASVKLRHMIFRRARLWLQVIAPFTPAPSSCPLLPYAILSDMRTCLLAEGLWGMVCPRPWHGHLVHLLV